MKQFENLFRFNR